VIQSVLKRMCGKMLSLPWGSDNQKDEDKSEDIQSNVTVMGFVKALGKSAYPELKEIPCE